MLGASSLVATKKGNTPLLFAEKGGGVVTYIYLTPHGPWVWFVFRARYACSHFWIGITSLWVLARRWVLSCRWELCYCSRVVDTSAGLIFSRFSLPRILFVMSSWRKRDPRVASCCVDIYYVITWHHLYYVVIARAR